MKLPLGNPKRWRRLMASMKSRSCQPFLFLLLKKTGMASKRMSDIVTSRSRMMQLHVRVQVVV
jgi:hypothetical protein